jgi:hypothetical protein
MSKWVVFHRRGILSGKRGAPAARLARLTFEEQVGSTAEGEGKNPRYNNILVNHCRKSRL